MQQDSYLTKPEAVLACVAIALFYVAILYAPTVIIRLPPASSLKQFLIRRFLCAAISSAVSIFFCVLILPVRSHGMYSMLAILGIRLDHIWQAVFFPLFLTSLMYTGSLVHSWKARSDQIDGFSFKCINYILQSFVKWLSSVAFNVLAWRNYVVAPLTEELVFRACIIPLLLCGGFKIYSVIFVCPVVFSLDKLCPTHLCIYINKRSTGFSIGLRWHELFAKTCFALLYVTMGFAEFEQKYYTHWFWADIFHWRCILCISHGSKVTCIYAWFSTLNHTLNFIFFCITKRNSGSSETPVADRHVQ